MDRRKYSGLDEAWRTFVIASIPDWVIAIVVAVVLHRVADVRGWGAALLVVAWIATDLATFPWRRRFYVSEPAERRIVGERGVALSELAPRGFVRVHGELWQAHTDGRSIPEGAALRVRDVNGLELTVEPAADRDHTAS